MKALYFYHEKAPFVIKDYNIFKKKFDVIEEFSFKIKGKASLPFLLIKQLLFIFKHLYKTDLIICQFVGYHSIFPVLIGKIFNKKTLLIPGGIDCVKFDSINYGNYTKKWLGKITNISYKLATHISPVHECLVKSDYTYQQNDLPQQGILVHCPNLKTPITVIHNGYFSDQFFPNNKQRIKNSFITIASNLDNKTRAKIKGVDLILEIASKFPNCYFFMIGFSNKNNQLSKNIEIIPFVDNNKLPALLSQYEFYFQLSLSEGFPNALSEAMLCECIPIGSSVSSIPDIIADTGFILKKKDPVLLAELIEKALKCDKEKLGKAARQRIIDNYNLETREQKLLSLIDSLVN